MTLTLLEPAEDSLFFDGTRFNLKMTGTEIPDYYEFLEISPQATQETIHRVYRFLAARYHPDHSGTGDLDASHPSRAAQITSM